MKKNVFLFYLTILLSFNLYSLHIKIGLKTNLKEYKFKGNKSGFRVFLYDKPIDYTFKNSFLRVRVSHGEFLVNNVRIRTKKLFIRCIDKKRVSIDGKIYRGLIMVFIYEKNRFSIINYVDLEDYLKGVVPCEVLPSFNIEALKAQAVVARTYAIGNLGKHKKYGFDLCATQHCQVYRGINSENTSTTNAVIQTKGLVIVYNNKLIKAFYHSSCGGYTANSNDVWGGKEYPYLKGVKCGFCEEAPHYKWEYHIKKRRFIQILRSKGIINSDVLSIEIIDSDLYGRVKLIKINNNVVTANWLRKTLDTSKLYSNAFKIYINEIPDYNFEHLSFEERIANIIKRYEKGIEDQMGNDVIFIGHGSGHGVGLCQWGANGLAKEGYDFKDILKYYFPGTNIIKYSKRLH